MALALVIQERTEDPYSGPLRLQVRRIDTDLGAQILSLDVT
jgi:hypothetical protein